MIKVDLNVDLRKIPSLSFPELKEYYDALFNIPTTSTRKEYYVWRISNKLQEMRFGELDTENKIHRLLDFTNNPRNIRDPWYTGNFDESYWDIYGGCQAFLDSLDLRA